MNFKEELCKKIADNTNFSVDDIYKLIEVPPNIEMGDFSLPCFKFAKNLGKSPQIIASELAQKLNDIDFIDQIKTAGPYLNFYLNKEIFCTSTIKEIIKEGENFGHSNIGKGKNVVIDFSSPNIAKPFHVGHLRSTVIGNALYNIYNFMGYNSIGVNHLGDWGTQFGKLIVAYKLWGDKKVIEEKGIEELNRIYVKFHSEAEKDPSLNDEARHWLVKMEDGDKEALDLWRWFNEISMIEFERIYKRLNIKFDYYTGESFYNDKINNVLKELEEKGILEESNKAKIVNLEEYNMPPCLILRSDGGTLYHTRDIATALYRKNTYDFEKCIYVTAIDQILHFKQLFKVIELMGYDWYKDLVHVPFGLVSLESGKLSTRKGNVVLMEELLNEAVLKTKSIIEEKNPNLENKDLVSEQVGIGAIIFNDLYNSRIKDVVFSWDRMLNFEGETGPYVQYSCVRANSVLEKGGEIDFNNIDFSILTDDASIQIIKLLYNYKDKIIEAGNKYEPFILTRHLVNIAQSFNKFYHDNPIIVSCEKTKNARLALVYCVKTVLEKGLSLLGISTPNKM